MFFEIRSSENINEKDERQRELDRLYLELADTFIGNETKRKKLLKRINELEGKKDNFNPDAPIVIF